MVVTVISDFYYEVTVAGSGIFGFVDVIGWTVCAVTNSVGRCDAFAVDRSEVKIYCFIAAVNDVNRVGSGEVRSGVGCHP